MLAILDVIALLETLAPSSVPIEASHCRFACSTTLRLLSEPFVQYIGGTQVIQHIGRTARRDK